MKKNQILSRALLVVAIIGFTAIVTSASCKVEINGLGGGLVVVSLDDTNVKVTDNGATVSVTYADGAFAATGAKPTDYAMTVAGTVTPFLTSATYLPVKGLFTVGILNATSGVVLSKAHADGDTLEKFLIGGPVDAATADALDNKKAKAGFSYNPDTTKGLSFVSAFLGAEGFAVNEPKTSAGIGEQIGLICAATATELTKDIVDAAKTADAAGTAYEGKKKFTGGTVATCSSTRDITGKITAWTKEAKTDTVRELKLSFIGINTGDSTVGDVMTAVPGLFKVKGDETNEKSGFTATTLKAIGEKFASTSAMKITVKIVAPAASS